MHPPVEPPPVCLPGSSPLVKLGIVLEGRNAAAAAAGPVGGVEMVLPGGLSPNAPLPRMAKTCGYPQLLPSLSSWLLSLSQAIRI